MKKFKFALFLFVILFIGIIKVDALTEGVSDSYHYIETSHSTNYFKIEFSDGNVALAEFDKDKYSALVNKYKSKISSGTFDDTSITRSPANDFLIENIHDEFYEGNSKYFSSPKIGDLFAYMESEQEISLTRFSINLKDNLGMQPVFAHLISGQNIIPQISSGTMVSSIRFVNLVNNSQSTSPEKGDTSGGKDVEQAGTTYCSDPQFIKPFRFLGRILSVIKIIIPIVIIAFGVWDMFRAVIASKDDEIKKSLKSLILRTIAGLVIFFIPTIINTIFYLVDDWNKYTTDYHKCSQCISNPNKC